MREQEAIWIGNIISTICASPIVNLGSSTAQHRQSQRATIDYIWGPLAAAGTKVIHVDMKASGGVDISGDIFEARTQRLIAAVNPRLIMCCNMLEHVPSPEALARICTALCDQVLVTVPFSYPYHADPIDTMYRPSPDDLAQLFPNMEMVQGLIVSDRSHWQTARHHHGTRKAIAMILDDLWRVPLVLLIRPRAFKRRFHRLLWLFRPYKITCALFRSSSYSGW